MKKKMINELQPWGGKFSNHMIFFFKKKEKKV